MNHPASLQELVRHAWEKVREIERKCDQRNWTKQKDDWTKQKDDYASYVSRLPIDIMISGLGQALAALHSSIHPDQKKNDREPRYWLWVNLSGWLCRDHPLAPYPNARDLLEAIMKHGPGHYRRAMTEAMNWLFWHKRFAEAYLKDRYSSSGYSIRAGTTKMNRKTEKRLPLYQLNRRQKNFLHTRPAAGNTGLWYEKFCNQWKWDTDNQRWYLNRDKVNWMRTVTGTVGDPRLLEEALERMEELVRMNSGLLLHTRTVSRFVTGLGRSHPTENGFTWHHTLGVPYLMGSSVKGMLRAWASEWIQADPRDIDRIFGPDGRESRTRPHAGSVLFLDALPAAPPRLEIDVISVHHQSYYMNKDKINNPPSDWPNPNVNHFLTVAADQPFVFVLLPRRVDEQHLQDVRRVRCWLEQALAWTGAGAKTAVGYGRFEVDYAKQEEWEKRLEQKEDVVKVN